MGKWRPGRQACFFLKKSWFPARKQSSPYTYAVCYKFLWLFALAPSKPLFMSYKIFVCTCIPNDIDKSVLCMNNIYLL